MITHVLGSDEVGVGPLAGPLVACAALVPVDWKLEGLRDSKKLTKAKLAELAKKLLHHTHDHAIEHVEAADLDALGLRKGLELVHTRALVAILKRTSVPRSRIRIIVDGNVEHCPSISGVEYLVKADTTIPAVMSGAILAKVARDRLMTQYAKIYPEFGFQQNAGYGTRFHLEALRVFGSSPIHRRLCEPVRVFE